VSCGFSFFVLYLWGVILLSGVWFVFARSLVVDWFCLSFFFDVTLVSLFLMVCLVCKVWIFVWIWYLTTYSSAVLYLTLCEHCLSSSLVLIISSSCVVEEEETEGVFRLRSKSARRLWHSGSVIVLVSFIAVMCC